MSLGVHTGAFRHKRGVQAYFCTAMTSKQKQIEIAKKLEVVPDAILQEVLDFLSDFEKKSEEEKKRIIALREILAGKRELLLRLAQ